MIPFKQTEMIKGCNPIKFYEYCAAGKNIISTSFDDIDDIHYYKIDHHNYETVIRNIIKNCDLRIARKEYIEYAKKKSWNNCIDTLMNLIKIDYTIIYPPRITYDFLMQRPAQFMRHFAQLEKIRAIFVDSKNYKETKNYKFLILNKNTFKNNIQKYIRGKLIFYYTYPDDIIFKNILYPNYTIFDLIDNPTEEFAGWNNDNLIKSIHDSDLFIASAKIMYDKYSYLNKNSIIISNGCDYDMFAKAINKLKKPNDIPNYMKNKIIIGYYGAHASWVDFKLIQKIADIDHKKIKVIMIGKSSVYDRTFEHPNIKWLDHKNYDQLPEYLSYFDICMIPFKLTNMIRGCDPIKFYEYISTGKPIIATKIEPILKYNDVCYFIDHHNYKQIINNIIDEKVSNEIIEKRQLIAKNNSWENKTLTIFNTILSQKINITIIYPPYIKWNNMFQRPQQMITALSRIDGVRCIFIDYSLKNGYYIINNSLIVAPSYENAIKYIKGKVIIYYNNPTTVQKLNTFKYDKCIFELVDNPVDEFSDWKLNLNKAIKTADIISITSKIMEKYVRNNGKQCKVIPNAADFFHFKRAEDKLTKPHDFPKVIRNKIIVGYYGAHASWVDWELVKLIADLDILHVVMIGKMEQTYNFSFNHKNITWLPRKDYDKLPYYLSWFDVCIIPFKLTEMIKGCDPIKFYEYCSAGKPIVATKMHELLKYKNLCYFMNHNNYKQMIMTAYKNKENTNLITKRQKLAQENSWDIRAKKLLEFIQS